MKFYTFLFLAACSIVMTGCNDNNGFTPINQGESLDIGPECRMGMCTWTKIKSIDVSSVDKDTVSVKVKNFYFSAAEENIKPTVWHDGAESLLTCSKTKPAYDGIDLDIKRGQPTSGAELSAVQTYFAVCHSFKGDVEKAKVKFDY